MSGTMNNSAQIELYLQREATVLGRAINTVTDMARQAVGLPGIRLQVAEQDACKEQTRHEIVDRGEEAVAASGLNASDRAVALSMIAGLETQYPGINQDTMNRMIEHTIVYVQERAEERVLQNRMNLFTDGMLQQPRSFDREAGLTKMEQLAWLLQEAEARLQDNLRDSDDYGPWDRVGDQMDIVYHSPDAMRIANEWGFHPTDFGPPLLTERGTMLQSSDITEKLSQERDLGHGR